MNAERLRMERSAEVRILIRNEEAVKRAVQQMRLVLVHSNPDRFLMQRSLRAVKQMQNVLPRDRRSCIACLLLLSVRRNGHSVLPQNALGMQSAVESVQCVVSLPIEWNVSSVRRSVHRDQLSVHKDLLNAHRERQSVHRDRLNVRREKRRQPNPQRSRQQQNDRLRITAAAVQRQRRVSHRHLLSA